MSTYCLHRRKSEIHNKLYELCLPIEAAGKAINRRLIAFAQLLAGQTLTAIDHLFGRKAVSVRLIWVSLMFSSAGMVISILLLFSGLGVAYEFSPDFARKVQAEHPTLINDLKRITPFLLQSAVGCAALGLLPALVLKPYLSWKNIPAVIALLVGCKTLVLYIVLVPGVLLLATIAGAYRFGTMVAIEVGLPVVCDLFVIAGIRSILRRVIRAERYAVTLLGLTIVIPPLLTCVPIWIIRTFDHVKQLAILSYPWIWSIAAVESIPMNAISILTSIGLSLLAIVLLLNLAFWPVISSFIAGVHADPPTGAQIRKLALFLIILSYAPSACQAAKQFVGIPVQSGNTPSSVRPVTTH